MYDLLPSFVLGFHGCDRSVAERVFDGRDPLKRSQNTYDWLGHGVYFWENDPERALEYATELRDRPRGGEAKVREPAVVGAVINLGRCLNLVDRRMIGIVKDTHREFRQTLETARIAVPTNSGGNDFLKRDLDCAVIEHLHRIREQAHSPKPPFDSVRGVFVEGKPIYPSAGFHEKSHIQICVRSSRCIKGYFRVLPESED